MLFVFFTERVQLSALPPERTQFSPFTKVARGEGAYSHLRIFLPSSRLVFYIQQTNDKNKAGKKGLTGRAIA